MIHRTRQTKPAQPTLAPEEGEEGLQTTYGRNDARPRALKNKYDPMNLFRMNQNIPPAV